MEKHLTERKNIKLTVKNVVRSRGLIFIEKLLKNTSVDLNVTDVNSRVSLVSSIATTLIPVQNWLMYQNLEANLKNFTRRFRSVNSYVLTVID